ncbi:SRPBCC family protein [Nocardiopsis sp. NPDC055551]|uniref:SRPBCC family protein n=1 Tax=Nocardiopsis sp. NPDC006832 TaxID=3157188 RepID=UPI0033EF33EF
MRIDNEFTVDAPIERVWQLFTDVEELAPCMPGAQLTGVEDEVYSGKVKVRVGPVVAAYKGTARFVERDDEAHRAVVEASGRADRGAGNAAATVTVRLAEADGRTDVTVETDLKITGKLAQLGGGMIKDVSERLLGQFVERAEERLAAPDTTEAEDMTEDKDQAGEGTGSTSHMSGGAHMSGGGHMSGGAHMSGGDQMAGSGPLSDERNESDGGAEPASTVPTAPTKRTIDGPEAEPVDLMAVSGGGRLLWPAIAVVVALAAGFLIGYAVFG